MVVANAGLGSGLVVANVGVVVAKSGLVVAWVWLTVGWVGFRKRPTGLGRGLGKRRAGREWSGAG